MKYIFLTLGGLSLLLTGCIKWEAPEPKTATQFKNLKVSESFTWQTSKPVLIKMSGISTPLPIRSTLYICTKEGDTLRKENRLMDENFTIQLQVPTITDSLVVGFGSIQKTYKVQSEIEANYIIPVSDLEN